MWIRRNLQIVVVIIAMAQGATLFASLRLYDFQNCAIAEPLKHIEGNSKMAINQDLWHEACGKEFRQWPCPSCKAGTVGLVENGIHSLETTASKKGRDDDPFEAQWFDEKFGALLKCHSCGEVVVASGKVSVEIFEEYDQHSGIPESFNSKFYSIKSIYPAPPVFTIHNYFPEKVSDELRASFSNYWSNHAACANSIRRTVEAVMIEQGMKTETDSGNPIFLHTQISEYSKTNPKISELLLGIKWFGNYGSHVADAPLRKNDLLKGFEVLEYVLGKIYIKRDEYIGSLAKEMTQNKGKP